MVIHSEGGARISTQMASPAKGHPAQAREPPATCGHSHFHQLALGDIIGSGPGLPEPHFK